MNQSELLEVAKKYLDMGFSVIPIGNNKRPTVKWTTYQKRLPTEWEINEMFNKPQVTGVAIVTGKVSNLVALDFDLGSKPIELPEETVSVVSGSGGKHYYFRYPKNKQLQSITGVWPKVDLRADGGIIIVPPSKTYKGQYKWIKSFDEVKLAELPEYLIDTIEDKHAPKNKTDFKEIVAGVSEGGRNDAATRIIGKLAYHLPESEWPTIMWPLIVAWNETNKPPLPTVELKSIFQSICQKAFVQKQGESEDLGRPVHIAELLAKPDQPIEWIVQDLLFAGSINIISAPPKSFKTWILLHLACQVATGQKVFGHFTTKQTKILFVQEEDFETIVKKRLKAFSASNVSEIYFWVQRGFKVDKEAHLKVLLNFIKENGIGLVLMDSFRRITFLSENESKEIAIFFSRLMEITKAGATVLMTHHDRKDTGFGSKAPEQKMRGSSDIFAALHGHLSVERNFKDDILEISQNKMKVQEEIAPFVVRVQSNKETGKVDLQYGGAVPKQLAQKERAKELIPSVLANGEMKNADIAMALAVEVGKSSVIEALNELVEEGYLVCRRGGKGGAKFYSVSKAV